jgi:hypothetical protein
MRGLGIGALILSVLSFFLWLASWIFWTFFAAQFIGDHPINYVVRTSSVISTIFEYLALALISIALIIGGGKLIKLNNQNNYNQR